jgi:carboxypeptidase Taq
VQLWDQFVKAEPDAHAHSKAGDFSPLRRWLQAEIHQYGRSYMPGELVKRVTGGSIDAGPYLAYLESKYRDIYKL